MALYSLMFNGGYNKNGFALLTVMMLIAIISLISVNMASRYLANTRASSLEFERIKAQQLLDAGVRFAALSLASPRSSVAPAAIPQAQLIYTAPDAVINVTIENESAFIDLIESDMRLLESALKAHGATATQLPELIDMLRPKDKISDNENKPLTYRNVHDLLLNTSINSADFLAVSSLHNGKRGVNSELASDKVLALVPGLSKAQRGRILLQRDKPKTSLIQNNIHNQHFITGVSAYYRISCSVQVAEQRYSQVLIIKMTNQTGRLFDVQARL
ncbi:MAG: hypothetical protein ACI9XU_000395 [Arenicella sp.]|jgi:hypothetical protein